MLANKKRVSVCFLVYFSLTFFCYFFVISLLSFLLSFLQCCCRVAIGLIWDLNTVVDVMLR